MSNALADLSAKQLRHAADLKEKIASLTAELDRLLASGGAVAAKSTGKKSKMSPAARAKIGAAQKKIWAARKAKAKGAAKKPA
ncbi:hypothetical protein GC207_13310 [bacterium]|nr:hypothetical protein [bacterium]